MGAINFVERQRSVEIYDYLVFICGVDVSPWIANLDITYSDRSGPGSADIVLSNPFNQWIITEENSKGHWRKTGQSKYSEQAKYDIFQAKYNLAKQHGEERKKGAKNGAAVQAGSGSAAISNPGLPDSQGNGGGEPPPEFIFDDPIASQDFLSQYLFGPGSCIFSKLDTVKIFIKDPFAPDTKANSWIPAFTGFVDSKPFTTDYITGQSMISIMAYDIRHLMTGMRMAVNPYQAEQIHPGNLLNVFNSEVSGFFKDIYIYQGATGSTGDPIQKLPGTDNIFAGMSFVDMVSLVLTGKINWVSPAGSILPKGRSIDGINQGKNLGIGNFNPGVVTRYTPKLEVPDGAVTSLESWDNLCLFGISLNTWDAPNREGIKPLNRCLTQQECRTIGKNSFYTEGSNKFDPLHGHVHFLIPAEGLNISDMIRTSFDGIKDVMVSPDWTDRFTLVNTICTTVDYEWSVTGSGDIIFEFPMYDFFPYSFGSNASVYTVERHLENENISDEGGEVFAAIEATTQSSQLVTGKIQNSSEANTLQTNKQLDEVVPITNSAIAYSETLVSKYGARIAPKTFYGVAYPQDAKDPLLPLKKLTAIELQRRLADANKLSMSFSFRPWIRPNRPLVNNEKHRIGKTTLVKLSFPPYTAAPTVSATVHCVRLPFWQGKEIVYQHITGGAAQVLSYNNLFEGPDDLSIDNTAGIKTSGQTTKNPTGATK